MKADKAWRIWSAVIEAEEQLRQAYARLDAIRTYLDGIKNETRESVSPADRGE